MSASHRKSPARWVVRGIALCLVCGAVWSWQSGWMITAIPASVKFLSAIGLKTDAAENSTTIPESVAPPVEHAATEAEDCRGAALDRRDEPVMFSRDVVTYFDEPRTSRQRAILTGYQESQTAGAEAEPLPVVAAKERTSSSAAKAQPVTAPKSSTTPITDLGGKSTPLLERAKIDQLIELGDFVTAQHELSRWYWQKPELRDALRPKLDDLAKALYFSPQPLFRDPHVVQGGDQLRVIAQRHKISWEYLARLNRTDPKKIREGQKLKVVDGPFGAIVFLSNYELIVHLQGSFVKSYRVGAGKVGSTPIGTFLVKNKLADPKYYGPDGLVIESNDPKNPLGERWIDIGDSYGIHGTIEPDTIGKNESRGCIRMLNADVEEVYDFLVVGSEVRIVR